MLAQFILWRFFFQIKSSHFVLIRLFDVPVIFNFFEWVGSYIQHGY